MFLESLGKLFFSQIRPLFFFSLLLTPLFAASFFLFSQISSLQGLETQLEHLLQKAQTSYAKKERQEHLLARYKNRDPFYLDHHIEPLAFLQSELTSLKALSQHPAVANRAPLLERIEFLSSENNRLFFTEEEIRTSSSVKETVEKQRFPVQMDLNDLKRLLSLLEDLPIDSFQPDPSSPQFLLLDFRLKKTLTPLQTDVFEVEMELLKREFL